MSFLTGLGQDSANLVLNSWMKSGQIWQNAVTQWEKNAILYGLSEKGTMHELQDEVLDLVSFFKSNCAHVSGIYRLGKHF